MSNIVLVPYKFLEIIMHKLTERLVSRKRHTIGYVIGGREYTRREAVAEARKGKIANARVVRSTVHGNHLVGVGGETLYDLPTRFPTSRRMANKRSR